MSFIYKMLWVFFTAIFGTTLLLSSLFLHLNPQLPDVSSVRNIKIKAPLRIYTADNKLIQEFGERLIPVTFSDLPPVLVDAVLAIEDKRFFQHGGVDPITIFNAAWQLVRNRGSIRSGASTIEMQLYKNISGRTEVRFIRKFKEILMAIKIEKELSKREILALYLNIIPYGKHAYGIQAAANTYYGKNLQEINLAQLAMLAGIAKKPEGGNPINGPEWALERRNLVLRRMLEQKSIDQDEYQVAISQPITAQEYGRQIEVSALYVAEMVRKHLLTTVGGDAYSQGLSVYTTIDSDMQNSAQKSLTTKLDEYDSRHGYRGVEHKRLQGTDDFLARNDPDLVREDEESTSEVVREEADAEPSDPGGEKIDQDYYPGSWYPENWIATLQNAAVVAMKYPAIVTLVEDQSISVLTKELDVISIPWEGLEWAKPYLTPHAQGPVPKKAADIVSVGDFIRISQLADDSWVLSQIPEIQGGLVALDPDTGMIKALVGGYDFYQKQFNHVTQAHRQPGSNFKPFYYTAALEGGLTAASIFNDAPMTLIGGELEEKYRPKNSGDFRGEVRLRVALYRSINLVSMRVIMGYGASKAIRYVKRFGFDTNNFPANVQLALGGGTIAVTPLDIATGYAAFANGGHKIDPYLINTIESADGSALFKSNPATVCRDCTQAEAEPEAEDLAQDAYEIEKSPKAPRIIEERVAYIMDSILADVMRKGTGSKAMRALKRGDLRGKTGTTNDADIWFSGYTRDLVATVWAGFDDNGPVGNNEWGSTVPLETWIEFARAALPPAAEADFLKQPDKLVTVRIDPKTGFRAKLSDKSAIFEIFREEYAPEPLEEFVKKEGEVVDPSKQLF